MNPFLPGEQEAFKRGLCAAQRIVATKHPLAAGALAAIQQLIDAVSTGNEDWRLPYRTMDASGSPSAAEDVGWAWIDEIAIAEAAVSREGLEIHSPGVGGDGRAIALYRGTTLLALATIFRDPMNFAVLVRWRLEP